ncbi:MAG: hypothetical protein RIE31_11255 [Alphaproteobacteria bacterium]
MTTFDMFGPESSKAALGQNFWLCFGALAAVYALLYGWILWSTDFLPYVMDGNETFSVLWHSHNMYQFDFFKSFWVTDESFGPDPAAHPFYHTSQGNMPRLFGYVIYALGARTPEAQVLWTVLVVGTGTLFLAYSYFARIVSPVFSLIACVFLFTDYLLYAQWHVVTYRVWYGFLLFAIFLCLHEVGGKYRRSAWAGLAISFLLLFYFELVFAAFVSLAAGLYTLVLYRRDIRKMLLVGGVASGAAVLSLSMLFTQLATALGADVVVKDFQLKQLSRNASSAIMDRLAVAQFYAEHNIAFWQNFIDGERFRNPVSLLNSVSHINLQVHTPILIFISLLLILGALVGSSRRFAGMVCISESGRRRTRLLVFSVVFVAVLYFLDSVSVFHFMAALSRDVVLIFVAVLLAIGGLWVLARVARKWSTVRLRASFGEVAVRHTALLALILLTLSARPKILSSARWLGSSDASRFVDEIFQATAILFVSLVVLYSTLFVKRLPWITRSGQASQRLRYIGLALLVGLLVVVGMQFTATWGVLQSHGKADFVIAALWCVAVVVACIAVLHPANFIWTLSWPVKHLSIGRPIELFSQALRTRWRRLDSAYAVALATIWLSAYLVFVVGHIRIFGLEAHYAFIHPQIGHNLVYGALAALATWGLTRIYSVLSKNGSAVTLSAAARVAVLSLLAIGFLFQLPGLVREWYAPLWMGVMGEEVSRHAARAVFVIAFVTAAGLSVVGIRAVTNDTTPRLHYLLLFGLAGLLSYVVVYWLSPGYVLTGYQLRLAPFSVFFTSMIPAAGLYILWIVARRLWPDKGWRPGFWNPVLPAAAVAVVAMLIVSYWAALQLSYVRIFPPDQLAFIQRLKEEPFKGRSFAVNNYAAPAAWMTGQWAYFDPLAERGGLEWREQGIRPRLDNSTYMWFADASWRPERYRFPDYFLCFRPKTFERAVAELIEYSSAASAYGCPATAMVQMLQDGTHVLDHSVIIADEEHGSWAIIAIDHGPDPG